MNGKEVKVGVCIYAENMDVMARFYRDTLQFQAKWDGGDFAEFETANGYLSFFMYSRKAFIEAINEKYIPVTGKINQSFEIGVWLPTFADVDAEYQRLAKLGVSLPTGEPKTFDFGIRNFYVADPEGNLLEIGSWNR